MPKYEKTDSYKDQIRKHYRSIPIHASTELNNAQELDTVTAADAIEKKPVEELKKKKRKRSFKAKQTVVPVEKEETLTEEQQIDDSATEDTNQASEE